MILYPVIQKITETQKTASIRPSLNIYAIPKGEQDTFISRFSSFKSDQSLQKTKHLQNNTVCLLVCRVQVHIGTLKNKKSSLGMQFSSKELTGWRKEQNPSFGKFSITVMLQRLITSPEGLNCLRRKYKSS